MFMSLSFNDLTAQAVATKDTLEQTKNGLEQISDSLTRNNSLLTLLVLIIGAIVLGKIVANILRRITNIIGQKADRTQDLRRVNFLRLVETYIVLSIALIRTILVAIAIYMWWVMTYGGSGQSTAILGASAVLTIILSGTLANTLRDVASGSAMMAEQWYGVGDHIKIEPSPDAQGVVERVTLRSTRIRKVTGEIMWINNKDIASVSIAPRGVHTIAVELFAKDEAKAIKLISDTNLRLPRGASAVVSPLTVMTKNKLGPNLWHITAISEVAPGRAWMIDKYGIDVLKELDEKQKTLANDPLTRFADSEAERRFARATSNALKLATNHPGVVERAVAARARAVRARKRKSH
jgi:hypothetical protein